MTKGISKYWTPEAEERYKGALAGCKSFAERQLLMMVMDLLKYDRRTKAGQRAIAQGRLRLIVSSDDDLEEMAELESEMHGEGPRPSIAERVEELKRLRAELIAKGVKKEELQCQKS